MRLVSNFYESNTFVIEKGGEVLIVDAGVEIEKVANVVGNKKVVGIFLSHGHFDHVAYFEEYAKKFHAKVYASEYIKEYLSDCKKNYSTDFVDFKMDIKDFSNFEFLSGSGVLHLGNFDVAYEQLGGHSKSDMCFLVDGELFVGDVIISRGIGRTDLYGGDKNEMIKSLKILGNMDYKIMHCGHGEDYPKSAQDKVVATYLRFLQR